MNQEAQNVTGAEPEPSVGEPQSGPAANPTGTMQQDAAMIFLSYFGIFAIIPFLTVKDNDYVRWHAKQGLTFLVATIVVFIGIGMFAAIIGFIPVIGTIFGLLLLLLYPVLGIACFAIWLIALVKAFGGQRWKIPLVGDFSERW